LRFFVYQNDEIQGPLTEEEIRDAVRSSRFFSTTQVCQEGAEEWKELHFCFADLEYAAPRPPSPPAPVTDPLGEPVVGVPTIAESLDEAERGKGRGIISGVYRNSILPSMKVAAPISAIGGFVADVLQPLGPISFYLTITAVAVAIVFGILWWVRCGNRQSRGESGIETRIAGASLVSAVVLATSWMLFTAPNPEQGFLGSHVSAVDALQRSILGVQESVDRVGSVVTKVSTDVQEIHTEVKGISDGISSLGRMGGLIKTPETAIEFYNNALVYKERGDVSSTREVLERYLATGEQKLEPYKLLVDVLKGMEGPEGARASYEALVAKYPDNLMLLHHLHHFLPKEEKIELLLSLIRSNPEFTPAFYDFLIRVSLIIDVDEELKGMFDIVHEKLTEVTSGIDHEEIKKENADKLARLRNDIIDEERKLQFLVEVRKSGLQRVLAETNESIHEVLNRHDFSNIYEAFLELEKRLPIKSYYYDQDNALNEGYPQQMYRFIPIMIEKLTVDLSRNLGQVDKDIEKSKLRIEELNERYEAGVNSKPIKL